MTWENIIKAKNIRDYRYGRCQTKDGTGCIRNLQSPERRKAEGDSNSNCMFCNDDSSKWADVPEEIWSSPEWKKADKKEKKAMLDAFVKKNPKYDFDAYEPSYY